MAADPDDTPEVSYAAALDELEQILVELDDDQLDVDVVAERVQRAAALIRVCRARIAGARMQVERVVASDVPTARWVSTEGSKPWRVKLNTSTGTMMMPPPTPNSPASTPAQAPNSR